MQIGGYRETKATQNVVRFVISLDRNCREKNTEFYAQNAKNDIIYAYTAYTYLLQATRSMELTKRQTDKIQTMGAKRSV